jgi:hypothetical protein
MRWTQEGIERLSHAAYMAFVTGMASDMARGTWKMMDYDNI